MSKVIQMQGYTFSTYKLGLRHILRTLESARLKDTEKKSFVCKQYGDFFCLARLRSGLSIEQAANYFEISAQDLVQVEAGESDLPALTAYRFCIRYGIGHDFQEIDALMREALNPDQRGQLAKYRPMLEGMGFLPPRQ